MVIISKTTFLSFLHCPKNVWLKIHRPEIGEKFHLSEFEKHILEQGNEVEAYARNLFPGAVHVVATGDDALQETVRFMASKAPTIFQATFLVDGFLAKNDMLSYDKVNDCWDLYEVKGTNSLKEDGGESRDHIDDLAFQVSVLRRANIKLGRYFVIHLNKEYVRSGGLDINALLVKDDVTDKVGARLPEVEAQMALAQEYLSQENEPVGGCECVYKSRKKHCSTFQYIHPHVPEYSVHDLSRIHKTKLELLVERSIFNLNDIPEDFELSDKQKNQVYAHRLQKPIISTGEIKKQLGSLAYPLYFFDYEAFGPAIPVFNGYGPYKRIPFQFSLHILRKPDGDLEHVEFLHNNLSDPSEEVARLLEQHIKPGGTVIAWYKSFEAGVNKEIGLRLPSHTALFDRINGIRYDLMEIFSDQHYIHHGFKGSASLKKVLPTLAPELSYESLGVRDGGQAADAWWKMVSPATTPREKAQISKDLKIYCGLDTYAMYAIWHCLQEEVGNPVSKRIPYPPLLKR